MEAAYGDKALTRSKIANAIADHFETDNEDDKNTRCLTCFRGDGSTLVFRMKTPPELRSTEASRGKPFGESMS